MMYIVPSTYLKVTSDVRATSPSAALCSLRFVAAAAIRMVRRNHHARSHMTSQTVLVMLPTSTSS
jgi:hypothetical protein